MSDAEEALAFQAKLRSLNLISSKTGQKVTVDDHDTHKVVVTTADERQDVHVYAPHVQTEGAGVNQNREEG